MQWNTKSANQGDKNEETFLLIPPSNHHHHFKNDGEDVGGRGGEEKSLLIFIPLVCWLGIPNYLTNVVVYSTNKPGG